VQKFSIWFCTWHFLTKFAFCTSPIRFLFSTLNKFVTDVERKKLKIDQLVEKFEKKFTRKLGKGVLKGEGKNFWHFSSKLMQFEKCYG